MTRLILMTTITMRLMFIQIIIVICTINDCHNIYRAGPGGPAARRPPRRPGCFGRGRILHGVRQSESTRLISLRHDTFSITSKVHIESQGRAVRDMQRGPDHPAGRNILGTLDLSARAGLSAFPCEQSFGK